MQSQRRTIALAALLTLFAGACQSNRQIKDSTWLIRHGRFGEAVEVARENLARDPDDAQRQAILREAEVAQILHQGRTAIFAGESEQALAIFEAAYQVDPESTVVWTWLLKTRRQLAVESLDLAHELASSHEALDEALAAYERALDYEPDRDSEVAKEALSGASRVLLLKNYRMGLSKSYYDEGLRAFRDYRLHPSRRGFSISDAIGDGALDASQRLQRVDGQLAEERVAQAQELEQQGLFYAAANEFRMALLIEPGHVVAKEGFNRLDREVRANRALTKAEMDIRRGDFDLGEQNIEAGEILTEAQQDEVGRMKAAIEEARLLELYEAARTLERDYKYREAVAAYDELLAKTEFFEDAIARRQTVLWLIESAEELYAKALEADSDDEAYNHLWEIHELLWPEYKDVEARLEAIQKRREAEKKKTPVLEGSVPDPAAGDRPGEGS